MAAFRNQVHTGSPSEDLCSRVSIQSFAMSGSGAMSTRAIAQFFTASEVSNAHEARRRSSGECGALSLSLSLSLLGRAASSADGVSLGKASAEQGREFCREATHKNPLTGTFLKFSETDDVRDMSAVGSLSQGQRGRERLAVVPGRAGSVANCD